MDNILAKNNSYLGFTDNMKAMERGRVEKVLARKIRYKNLGVMERRDHILNSIIAECEPFSYEDNKTCYGISVEKGSSIFYSITKNEYDFAVYLLNNGFTTESAVIDRIDAEIKERRRIAGESEEAARKESERIKKEAEEKKTFDEWVKSELENIDSEKKALIEQIFDDAYGERFDHAGRKIQWNYSAVVYIDNFDNPRCKEMLHQFLDTRNKGTRKYFECVTGLKLPKTNKETRTFIDGITSADLKEPKPYKKRKQPKEKELETFYIAEVGKDGKSEFRAVEGEKLDKYDLHLFIHIVKENHGSYTVDKVGISSVDCGYRLTMADTKTKAMEQLKEVVERIGKENIQQQIADIGEAKGWSPLSYNK